MEIINFDKMSEPLKVKVNIKNGVMAIAYYIKLSEKNSNKSAAVYEGDNQNPEDDVFILPTPVGSNEGRVLWFSADFVGLDLAKSSTYEVAFEIFQGHTLLKSIQSTGSLTASAQSILLFAKLM
jgi:hypothetical protein